MNEEMITGEVIVASEHVGHGDPIAPIIFGVTLILVAALVGRYTARYFKQPTVLGELLIGIVLGNLFYYLGSDLMLVLREGVACTELAKAVFSGTSVETAISQVISADTSQRFYNIMTGPHGQEYLSVAQTVDVFSRYGVIFLLFHVGLDTCVSRLRSVGGDALRVALIGVVAPFMLGVGLTYYLIPDAQFSHLLFLGAALGATSIGITARVLNDIRQQGSREAQLILGAAVMDDVLGLLMLAIVSSIVVKGVLDITELSQIIVLAGFFIAGIFALGPQIIKLMIRLLGKMDIFEAKLFIPFVFTMTLAWLASMVGLASIVGAFAAGLLLLDSQFKPWGDVTQHRYTIKELFAPLEAILVPIFFVLMGIRVKLELFLDPQVILLAGVLLLVAIVGKVMAGLGVFSKGISRLSVGIGMMPRGEVGLVFASIGVSLQVIDAEMFSAIVLMVVVTTLLTPPLLKLTLGEGDSDAKRADDVDVCR